MTNWITAIGRLFRQDVPASSTMLADRLMSYMAWDGYYQNTVYNSVLNGGQRDNINAILGSAAATDLAGLYNPVARAVDLYQHVLGGDFGVDIKAVPGPLATRIDDPLQRIWGWSNMNIQKQVLCRLAPTHGNVGLRIVARNHADPTRRRVYLKPEHPRVIRDAEVDERGNVQAVQLEYEMTMGIGDEQVCYTIREEQTKTEFKTWRVENGHTTPFDLSSMQDNGPFSSYPNDLGVVPYVLLSHTPTGNIWSTNAFARVVPLIDRLNALAVHINTQVHRHVNVKWLVAANGAPPTSIDLGDSSVAYINLSKDSPTPMMQPMVAPLSLGDAITQSMKLLDQIEDELPELKATGGKFMSGQSGETVAQLRKPAEDRLALARSNYEDALIRAQQIALSFGVMYSMWDVGTGMGTADAANRAYSGGYEDHVFNSRELLPLTEMERLAVQTQKQALGVSKRHSLGELGYSVEDIDSMEADNQAVAAGAVDAFGRAFNAA